MLLEDILKEQLRKINKIEYKQKEFEFTDANISDLLKSISTYSGNNSLHISNNLDL